MNAVAKIEPRGHMTERAVENYGDRSLTAADIQAQVNLMQDVMRSVMFDKVHYGVIPGTQSRSLYKAGAEKLMATFRLACDPETVDLSADGEVHYRVKVRVTSASGLFLGAGIGECSSREDKYAWRAAVCPEEFEATPENRRRIKFAKYQGKIEQKKQVRTNPADVANTILKMAKKRAQVDAVITVTAASDIFTQDIEDLPDELYQEIADDARSRTRPGTQAVERTVPPDSPERDKLITEATEASKLGTEAYAKFWQAIGKDGRNLIADKHAEMKERAAIIDADRTGSAS